MPCESKSINYTKYPVNFMELIPFKSATLRLYGGAKPKGLLIKKTVTVEAAMSRQL